MSAVGNRPGSQNAGRRQCGRLGNGNAVVVRQVAKVWSLEIESSTGVPHKRGKAQICGIVGGVCTAVGRDNDGVGTHRRRD